MKAGFQIGACLICVCLLLGPAAQAADKGPIQDIIQRGVIYLKKQQRPDGTWPFYEKRIGASALAALTLLECGVSSRDPVIQRATFAIRPASIELNDTYSLSTAILYLDRLGDLADVPFIQSMAIRLLAGQNASGGWTYSCPSISSEEVHRLKNHLRKLKQPGADLGSTESGGQKVLSREIQRQLKLINPLTPGPQFSDNSNTKFATLALWVARRHGMPVEKALSLVENRFRRTQNGDGGWGYLPGGADAPALGESSATMTCAGLLGLATGYASASAAFRSGGEDDGPAPVRRNRDPAQDDVVRTGIRLLATVVGQPIIGSGLGGLRLFGAKEGDEYYYLWAIERVAVAYGLKTIGDIDWYNWGSAFLLANQRQDGSWQGKYGAGGVDTCFALLFLQQANLSKDLSTILKSGGVGGVDLESRAQKATKPASPNKQVRPQAPKAPAPDKNSENTKASQNPTHENPSSPRQSKSAQNSLTREMARLSNELARAPERQQEALLKRYRDEEGVAYTQALALAIPQLQGSVKGQARDVLAERLERMTSGTLRARLKDDDVEIRRAAAIACAMQKENKYIPDLIPLLDDPDAKVSRAAHFALRELAGKDLGSKSLAWKSWWKSQQ